MAFAFKHIVVGALLLGMAAAPSFAQTVQSTVTLSLGGDAEQRSVDYDCGDFGQIDVSYVDAAPNFLALIPYKDKTLVFAAVISGSGVRYASGIYEWRTKGTEAGLYDLTAAADTPPLASCTELNIIP